MLVKTSHSFRDWEVVMTVKAFNYYGGKNSKIGFIIPQLKTEHQVFVEVCAGSAAVLLNKLPAQVEVLNDLSSEVATFWKVMREQPDELIRQINCSPPGESEYKRIKQLPPCDDEIEIARRFYVRTMQSFSFAPNNGGYSINKSRNFVSVRRGLDAVVDRIKDVTIENVDACKLILRIINAFNYGDNNHPVLYCDPPYTADSRVSNGEYIHDDFNHDELLDTITNAPAWCKFAISGYANPLYDETLADWHRVELECFATGNRGAGNPRTEILWRNYDIETSQTMLDL